MDYFNDQQARELVDRLVSLTELGRLVWQQANSEYVFMCQIKSTAFALRSKDGDDLAPHILAVFVSENGGGARQIQEIDSTYLEPWYAEKLQHLYMLVKRATLKIDIIAENILADLEEIDVEPPS